MQRSAARSPNRIRRTKGEVVFDTVNYIVLSLLGIITLYPIINVLAISLSSYTGYLQNPAMILPAEFNLDAYKTILSNPLIMSSYSNTITVALLGTVINVVLTVVTAYPLAKEKVRGSRALMFGIVFTMMFSGGIIPTLQDPDGNGIADTYGVTDTSGLMTSSGAISIDYFARAWHADKNWYVGEDGELLYGMFAQDGRFKNVLEFYRDLYSDGSLDPNFISLKGTTDMQQRLEQGAVGALRLFAGNMDRHLSVLRGITPEADLEFVDFPTSSNSEQYAAESPVSTSAGLYNGWALTTTAKGKEEQIIKVLDWFLSDEGWNVVRNGVEGVHYQMNGDTIERLDPEYTLFSQYSGYVQLLRRPNDEALWLKDIIPEKHDYEKEWLTRSVEAMQQYEQEGLMGIQSDAEKSFLKSDLYTTEFPQLCIEIIYGEKPLDAWDEFIEKIYNNGWQDVVDEYNTYYQAHTA